MRKFILMRIINPCALIVTLLFVSYCQVANATGDGNGEILKVTDEQKNDRGKLWMEVENDGMTLEEANAQIESEPEYASSAITLAMRTNNSR